MTYRQPSSTTREFDNQTEACRHCPTPEVHPRRIGGMLSYESDEPSSTTRTCGVWFGGEFAHDYCRRDLSHEGQHSSSTTRSEPRTEAGRQLWEAWDLHRRAMHNDDRPSNIEELIVAVEDESAAPPPPAPLWVALAQAISGVTGLVVLETTMEDIVAQYARLTASTEPDHD